ncbi:hypothetical protein CTAM01_00595 [Colletotrichum tamarilloi]|uniref:Uncharacterized protein n=1 Tax=Colletotrichum tamarilloi TaxID=1209934 RepID=A0ABQ9RVN3_9PEZI|nr:uncharacterized protein CTAM01_00595 [Colletotrichum tamarilloi]KAK1513199.1 hypothetical protein CTAM01_00595 [Colletotrichum tamarilloi]
METAARRDHRWGRIARFDQVSTCTAEDGLKWAIGHPHLSPLSTDYGYTRNLYVGNDLAVQPHQRPWSRDAFVQINIRVTRNASAQPSSPVTTAQHSSLSTYLIMALSPAHLLHRSWL